MKSCCYSMDCKCNKPSNLKVDDKVSWSGNTSKTYTIAEFGTWGEKRTAVIYDGNGAVHHVLVDKLTKK